MAEGFLGREIWAIAFGQATGRSHEPSCVQPVCWGRIGIAAIDYLSSFFCWQCGYSWFFFLSKELNANSPDKVRVEF